MTLARKKKKPEYPIALVCPDSSTSEFIRGELKRAELFPSLTIVGKGDAAKLANSGMGFEGPPLLLLVPSASLGTAQLMLIKQVLARKGLALAWCLEGKSSYNLDRDEWFASRLAEQSGALSTDNLKVLIEAARIASLSGRPAFDSLRILDAKSALGLRLKAACQIAGLNVDGRSRSGLSIDLKKKPALKTGSETLLIDDPFHTVHALALLREPKTAFSSFKALSFEPELKELNSILRPLPRLLSEVTSKRVIRCFGLKSPEEQLCKSASKAVQFASSIDGPVVLKLVKPALTGKSAAGAVYLNVQGAPDVRRAFQSLLSAGAVMGPPQPLGVLVSRQVPGGDRIWVIKSDHAKFGKLLVLGAYDSPANNPATALKLPVTLDESMRALLNAGLVGSKKAGKAMAVSIVRFSSLLIEAGERIGRAEIHPLVATCDLSEALALDALIEICI